MPSYEGQLKTFQIVSLNPSNLNCVLTRDKAIHSIIYRASKSPEGTSKLGRMGDSSLSAKTSIHSKRANTITRLSKTGLTGGMPLGASGAPLETKGSAYPESSFNKPGSFKKPQKIIFTPKDSKTS